VARALAVLTCGAFLTLVPRPRPWTSHPSPSGGGGLRALAVVAYGWIDRQPPFRRRAPAVAYVGVQLLLGYLVSGVAGLGVGATLLPGRRPRGGVGGMNRNSGGGGAPRVEREDDTIRITMTRGAKRNALSREHLTQLLAAVEEAGGSDATGIVLAAEGPVFSAGHDFADVAGSPLPEVRSLLALCTELMGTLQSVPQVVVARVHALATAAGCQLVASCDLAVAAESAGFAAPGGKGGWFCHTPMVAIARNVGRKRAMELALTGDVIDARTALAWGLVNRVVPDAELDAAVDELLRRATRGSRASKAWGKQTMYAQLDRPERDAYVTAVEVMASASQIAGAQEGMAAFLEKRPPVWTD
jgi:enoyl-CoA hydratase/carnithine racemase